MNDVDAGEDEEEDGDESSFELIHSIDIPRVGIS